VILYKPDRKDSGSVSKARWCKIEWLWPTQSLRTFYRALHRSRHIHTNHPSSPNWTMISINLFSSCGHCWDYLRFDSMLSLVPNLVFQYLQGLPLIIAPINFMFALHSNQRTVGTWLWCWKEFGPRLTYLHSTSSSIASISLTPLITEFLYCRKSLAYNQVSLIIHKEDIDETLTNHLSPISRSSINTNPPTSTLSIKYPLHTAWLILVLSTWDTSSFICQKIIKEAFGQGRR